MNFWIPRNRKVNTKLISEWCLQTDGVCFNHGNRDYFLFVIQVWRCIYFHRQTNKWCRICSLNKKRLWMCMHQFDIRNTDPFHIIINMHYKTKRCFYFNNTMQPMEKSRVNWWDTYIDTNNNSRDYWTTQLWKKSINYCALCTDYY